MKRVSKKKGNYQQLQQIWWIKNRADSIWIRLILFPTYPNKDFVLASLQFWWLSKELKLLHQPAFKFKSIYKQEKQLQSIYNTDHDTIEIEILVSITWINSMALIAGSKHEMTIIITLSIF